MTTDTMTRIRTWSIITGLVLLVGVVEAVQSTPSPKPAPGTSAVADAEPTIQQIMATTIGPASKLVFEAVSTVTVRGKEQQRVPTTAAEWEAVRKAARQMVESAATLTTEGRHVARNLTAKGKDGELSPREIEALIAKNRPAWDTYAREFAAVAAQAAASAEKKDVDGVFGAAGDLDTACENCHQVFWYPDQDKLFEKKLGRSLAPRPASPAMEAAH